MNWHTPPPQGSVLPYNTLNWFKNETNEKRDSYICMNEEQALAIADTIYKLLKKN